MQASVFRLISAGGAVAGLAVSAYFLFRCFALVHAVPEVVAQVTPRATASESTSEEEHKTGSPSAHADVLVSLEELLVNVTSRDTGRDHTVSLKLELELFDESEKPALEQRMAGITD